MREWGAVERHLGVLNGASRKLMFMPVVAEVSGIAETSASKVLTVVETADVAVVLWSFEGGLGGNFWQDASAWLTALASSPARIFFVPRRPDRLVSLATLIGDCDVDRYVVPSVITRYPEELVTDTTAVGGTFDRLHLGHQALLLRSYMRGYGGSLVVGVSSPAMVAHKSHSDAIQSFDDRVAGVRAYLDAVASGLGGQRVERVAPITFPLDIAGTEPEFSLLVVSEETAGGVSLVNDLRRKNGFKPLKSDVVSLVTHAGVKMSSSDLRERASNEF